MLKWEIKRRVWKNDKKILEHQYERDDRSRNLFTHGIRKLNPKMA